MRGRCSAAASVGLLKFSGFRATALGLLLVVAACTPIKYPPDRNKAEQPEPTTAEAAVASDVAAVAAVPETVPQDESLQDEPALAPQAKIEDDQAESAEATAIDDLVLSVDEIAIDESEQQAITGSEQHPDREVELHTETTESLESEEEDGGFWSSLGGAFGLSGDDDQHFGDEDPGDDVVSPAAPQVAPPAASPEASPEASQVASPAASPVAPLIIADAAEPRGDQQPELLELAPPPLGPVAALENARPPVPDTAPDTASDTADETLAEADSDAVEFASDGPSDSGNVSYASYAGSYPAPAVNEAQTAESAPDAQINVDVDEESGGFWSGLGESLGLSGGDSLDQEDDSDAPLGAPLGVTGAAEARGIQHPESGIESPPMMAEVETAPEAVADLAGDSAEEADVPPYAAAVEVAEEAAADEVLTPEEAAHNEAAGGSDAELGDNSGGFWSGLGDTFDLSRSESDEVATSDTALAPAETVEPQGSHDPEAGEGDSASYAEYEIVAVMLEQAENTGEAATERASAAETEPVIETDAGAAGAESSDAPMASADLVEPQGSNDGDVEADVEVAQILAEIQAAAGVASESSGDEDVASSSDPDYEGLYGAPLESQRIQIQKAQADGGEGASFTDFDYEALYLAPVVSDRAEVLRTEAYVAASDADQEIGELDGTTVVSEASEPEIAEPDVAALEIPALEMAAPEIVTPEIPAPKVAEPGTTEVQLAEADTPAPPETTANEERLGFWSGLGDSLGLGAPQAATSESEASDVEETAPEVEAAPATVAQSAVSPAPTAALEAGTSGAATDSSAGETVQPLAEASASSGSGGEQLVALTPSQIASARQAFAVPVRPGDVVEVRFYRNTRLDN